MTGDAAMSAIDVAHAHRKFSGGAIGLKDETLN